MKKQLKRLAAHILSPAGVFPTAQTKKEQIENLIQKLTPFTTDKELIRIGPNGDGGYLVPDDLTDVSACFSPGVSFTSGFERECAERGINVFMADRSVEKPTETHERFSFIQKFIGATTNDDFMTIDSWVSSSVQNPQTDLILQIDIEGYEYETFIGMSDSTLNRFRVIVAEFHWLDQLWSRSFFRIASSAFDKILQTHHCVHIHPNNCHTPLTLKGVSIPPTIEMTFLRKDRISRKTPTPQFPHRLDFDNTQRPHFPLPECWYNRG